MSEEEPKIRIETREDGPDAFRADLQIDGQDQDYRRTLCRCGASKNKPYCDNSRKEIGLKATGEPDTRLSSLLKIEKRKAQDYAAKEWPASS